MRTSNGCWTCRLRRKKCDERRPACAACTSLHITCHFNQDEKPAWMDGGPQQDEMAERIKREIKALRRRQGGGGGTLSDGGAGAANARKGYHSRGASRDDIPRARDPASAGIVDAGALTDGSERDLPFHGINPIYAHGVDGISHCETQQDAVLITFYFDTLLPFLYPLYRPSIVRGGRSWVLDMMKRPSVRQTALCQSVYFLAIATGRSNGGSAKVYAQTEAAFKVLRDAIPQYQGLGRDEDVHAAVRILTSIVQLKRFEGAVLGFDNWQIHQNAAIAVFRQLLGGVDGGPSQRSRYETIMRRCGPETTVMKDDYGGFFSSEQSAFAFTSAILVLDDVIASTVLQARPALYESLEDLLGDDEADGPAINIETVMGVQNCVVMAIGETSALDAWKRECQARGSFDVLEHKRRAKGIKEVLLERLRVAEDKKVSTSLFEGINSAPPTFHPCECFTVERTLTKRYLVGKIWAHTALAYISIVANGGQPCEDLHQQVSTIIDLANRVQSIAMLRLIAWPICLAGCFAEASQIEDARKICESLHPCLLGTLGATVNIMERVWELQSSGLMGKEDLASRLRVLGNMPLLV